MVLAGSRLVLPFLDWFWLVVLVLGWFSFGFGWSWLVLVDSGLVLAWLLVGSGLGPTAYGLVLDCSRLNPCGSDWLCVGSGLVLGWFWLVLVGP
eukprot:653385-Karenia_brevis.AAC.1